MLIISNKIFPIDDHKIKKNNYNNALYTSLRVLKYIIFSLFNLKIDIFNKND